MTRMPTCSARICGEECRLDSGLHGPGHGGIALHDEDGHIHQHHSQLQGSLSGRVHDRTAIYMLSWALLRDTLRYKGCRSMVLLTHKGEQFAVGPFLNRVFADGGANF